MTEQRFVLVALAFVCCLVEVKAAQIAVAQTICSGTGSNGGCGSGAAQSSSTGANGITTGECAYTNPHGQYVKIKFQEYSDGKINAEAVNSNDNALVELGRCREAVGSGQLVAQQDYNQIQDNHQQLQQQILRQQQQLQGDIFRQQQAIFNQRNFPLPIGFNPFQFPNFHQAGFGPQF